MTKLLLERGAATWSPSTPTPAMVAKARETLPATCPSTHQDLLDLELDEPVDVVFSCAVFHWITDHERLFARLHARAEAGRRGSSPSAAATATSPRVLEVVGDRPGTWLYATPEDTERRLRDAGFARGARVARAEADHVDDMETYLRTVILHGQPDARGDRRARRRRSSTHLDYVRLNIEATA